MYKKYSIPFTLKENDWEIQFLQNEKIIHFIRKCFDNTLEKKLLTNKKNVAIQPIEPLLYPKEISDYLLIELEQIVSISPNSTQVIFLTFPIEIGVFLPKGKEWELLDVFSLSKAKFTLYGDPANGVISKYWSSSVFENIPAVDFLKEGVLKLEISNQSDEWLDVHKTLLKSDGMKLFYDEQMVCMQAKMKLHSKINAETTFINEPINKNMEKSIEVFSQKRLSLSNSKVIMLEGI
jgi:hypothetical protein